MMDALTRLWRLGSLLMLYGLALASLSYGARQFTGFPPWVVVFVLFGVSGLGFLLMAVVFAEEVLWQVREYGRRVRESRRRT